MQTLNVSKVNPLIRILKLFLFLIISCSLAIPGSLLSIKPVQAAACTWLSTTPQQLTPTAYQPYYFSFQGLISGGCPFSFAISSTWIDNSSIAGLYWDASTGSFSGTPIIAGQSFSGAVHANCGPPCNHSTIPLAFTITVLPSSSPPPPPPTPTTYDFTVKIGPGLTSGTTKVLIDGVEKGSPSGGQAHTFTTDIGTTHVVTVDKTVVNPSQPNMRFTVKGPNEQTVSESNTLAYFDYATGVLINVNTSPDGVAQLAGTGWYAMGDDFKTSAPGTINNPNKPGTQYRFNQWNLLDGTTSTNKDLLSTVNSPGTVTAVYSTYYLLTLKSDYPPINQTSWYVAGSDASYNLALASSPIPGFWGFLGGKMTPVNDSGTHRMDGPYTQKITWKYDYTVPIVIIVVVVLLLIGLAIFLVLRRRKGTKAAAPLKAEAPKQPEAVPTQQTKAEVLQSKTEATVTTVPEKPVSDGATKVVPMKGTVDEKKEISAAVPEAKLNFCPKCGSAVTKGQDFCSKCGKKLKIRPGSKICPKCQTHIATDQKFCANCGEKLE